MQPAQLKKTEREPMEMALSIDIVMDVVVKHLKVRDLLSCRLVSKCWNKAASTVLRRRSTMMKNISEENQLMELQECMMESLDFPFTGLKFDKPWALNSNHAMKFFRNYGNRFKRLRLDTDWCEGLHVLAPFINHLPRLLILEVGQCLNIPPSTKLGDPAAQQGDDSLKFPSVQILRFSSSHSSVDTEVLLEVFAAASPSLRIECPDASDYTISQLKHAGKLRAVSCLKIVDDFASFNYGTDRYLSTESPSLTKLDFTGRSCLTLDVLERVLSSSQHTLKEFRLNGTYLEGTLGTLWGRSPVFPKLTMVNLCVKIGYCREYLFQGAHGPKFPALKELKLEIVPGEGIALSDGLFIVPSVTRIDLEGYISHSGMEQLAQTFPNVVEMGLQYEHYCGNKWYHTQWSSPMEIWSVRQFKFLEKLRIWNCTVKRPTYNYINMDSFLTGIPFGICENLLKQKQLFQLHVIHSPFREAFGEVVRDNPSILELKNLKELIVCLDLGHEYEQLPEETPFMSMISIWHALDMMPNLRTKFVYEEPWPPSPYEGRYKAVLEAEFKHVQQYVKLERFFY